MEVGSSRDGRPEIWTPASVGHPLFLIQPRTGDLNGSDVPVLLARQFTTTLMGLTDPSRSHMRRSNAHHHDRKLSIRTDHEDGARIYSPFEMTHRHEVPRPKPWTEAPFGHLNRNKKIAEIVSVGRGEYVLFVRAVSIRPFRDSIDVRVSAFRGDPPLLAVTADTLFRAFPELERDTATLLDKDLTFGDLAKEVRKAAKKRMDQVLLLESPVDPPRT